MSLGFVLFVESIMPEVSQTDFNRWLYCFALPSLLFCAKRLVDKWLGLSVLGFAFCHLRRDYRFDYWPFGILETGATEWPFWMEPLAVG